MSRRRKPQPSSRPPSDAPAPPARRPWFEVAALALIATITFIAYRPALNGQILWDDDAHITLPELRSLHGLYRIWFELNATQQYYPLLHSAFWLEHKLWGDTMLGYHLVNVFLHIGCVVLLYLVLRRLKIPGALLAAAIFAVHPVMVESVAWISEQKNTLSGVFYLSAMYVYLGFDESRRPSRYFASLALFVLGLLTKTVTATLPAALLVIFWWQRGTLSWKRDVLPLLPFFALGAAAGYVTAWVERDLIGAQGAGFEMTLLERGLLAGRVVWFYLSKLVLPANLMFIYPRWKIDAAIWWQWLFPIATLSVVVLLWAIRRKSRAPLAGWLLFVGTLAPVLGFVNVYPFVFSFVADHFQYLASLGMIVLSAAGIAIAIRRAPTQQLRWFAYGGCILIIATLAVLTARQCRMYSDVTTLFWVTLERNPECWLAYDNLGGHLALNGKFEEAVPYYERAISINPRDLATMKSLGFVLMNLGKLDEAIQQYRTALSIEPRYTDARRDLAQALILAGRAPEAIEQIKPLTEENPNDALSLSILGKALSSAGRPAQARELLERALRLRPDLEDAHVSLGLVLAGAGNLTGAAEQLRSAIAINARSANAHSDLAAVLATQGKFGEAIPYFERAIELGSNFPDIHMALANAYRETGNTDKAIEHYEMAVRLQSNFVKAYFNLAKTLVTLNRSEEAIAAAQKGIDAARTLHDDSGAAEIEDWLSHYERELKREAEEKSSTK